jgi:hypothetical protein
VSFGEPCTNPFGKKRRPGTGIHGGAPNPFTAYKVRFFALRKIIWALKEGTSDVDAAPTKRSSRNFREELNDLSQSQLEEI